MRLLLAAALVSLVVVSGAAGATFKHSVATPSPVTVAGVTLNGVDQVKTFTIDSTVQYTGGQNTAGWKVQASATTPASGSNTLPALQVTDGTFSCVSGCNTNPTNGVTYPITLSTTAQTIFNAAAGTGQGTFTVTSTFALNYVANALPGTYSSTVTLSGSTGP
jgi:hypothetical protein